MAAGGAVGIMGTGVLVVVVVLVTATVVVVMMVMAVVVIAPVAGHIVIDPGEFRNILSFRALE